MKHTTIFFALLGLTACTNQAEKIAIDEKSKLVHVDSLYIDSNQVNGAGGQPYKEFHNCNFDKLITDTKTSKLAKDIYLDNNWNLNNHNEALALLDSLTAKNKTSRPFYFKVVTKTYEKSDGYFSEGLGLAGKEYVENNTQEFFSNFDNKNCFTESDLTTWANIVMLEFSISGEEEYNKPIIDKYIQKLNTNCKDCSAAQKENMAKFGLILKNKWKEFLKSIDR